MQPRKPPLVALMGLLITIAPSLSPTGFSLGVAAQETRRTEMEFEEDHIEGERARPDGYFALGPPITAADRPGDVDEIKAKLKGADEAARPALYDALALAYRMRAAEQGYEALEECLTKAKGDCSKEEAQGIAVAEADKARARALEQRLIKETPNYPRLDRIMWRLAEEHLEKKQFNQARDLYVKIIKNYPKSEFVPHVILSLADILFDENQVENALKTYNKFSKSYPSHKAAPYSLYKQAWCHLNLQQHNKAVVLFVQIIRRLGPKDELSKAALNDLTLAFTHVDESNPEKVIQLLKKIAPDQYLKYSARLGEAYRNSGNFNKSNKVYKELMKLNPNKIDLIEYSYQITENNNRVGDRDSTIKQVKMTVDLFKSIKISKKDHKKHTEKLDDQIMRLATEIHKQSQKTHNPKEAEQAGLLYEIHLNHLPVNKNTYNMCFYYAELLFKMERWVKSIEYYKRGLKLEPEGQFKKDMIEGIRYAEHQLKRAP